MGSPILGALRLIVYLLWTLLLVPLQAMAVALRLGLRRRIPLLYHRGCLWVFGLDVVVLGTPSTERPTLFVSNHTSYLDIEVLGALITGSFVAKSEVAGWPLFGFLAKLQETVFINRSSRQDARRQGDSMVARLTAGDSLILFPEGTSSDGNRVLPFKTALFAVASLKVDDRPLTVQPISITAVALDRIPMGRLLRPLYAWYGDMRLAPHLWQLARVGGVTLVVEFHPTLTAESAGSRKALAEACWHAVRDGVARAVAGRVPVAAAPAPTAPARAAA